MPLLTSKKPPSYSVPTVKSPSSRERTGIAYKPIAASPAVKNSRFLNAGFVSAAPGPPFVTRAKQPRTLPPQFPACPITRRRGDLRSVLGSRLRRLRPAAEEGDESKAAGEMPRALIPFPGRRHHFHDGGDAGVVQGSMEVNGLGRERREKRYFGAGGGSCRQSNTWCIWTASGATGTSIKTSRQQLMANDLRHRSEISTSLNLKHH